MLTRFASIFLTAANVFFGFVVFIGFVRIGIAEISEMLNHFSDRKCIFSICPAVRCCSLLL